MLEELPPKVLEKKKQKTKEPISSICNQQKAVTFLVIQGHKNKSELKLPEIKKSGVTVKRKQLSLSVTFLECVHAKCMNG